MFKIREIINEQRIVVIALFLIVVLALILNNIRLSPFEPAGSDDHSYMGDANQMVIFQNKNLSSLVYRSSEVFPYFAGLVKLATGLDVNYTFRIVHTILLIFIVLSFYRLGRTISSFAGILLSIFAATLTTTTFWNGMMYMVPGTFVFLTLPNITFYLIKYNLKNLVLWLAISTLLYWWMTPLFLFLLLIYALVRKKKYVLLVLLIGAALLSVRFLGDFVLVLTQSSGSFDRGALFTQLHGTAQFYYIGLLSIITLYALYRAAKEKILELLPLFIVGLSLVFINLFFLAVAPNVFLRSTMFTFVGLSILTVLFFETVRKRLPPITIGLLFVLVFAPLLQNTVWFHYNDVSGYAQISPAERKMMNEINKYTSLNSLILSDHSTMKILPYYIDNRNFDFMYYDYNYHNVLVRHAERILTFLDNDKLTLGDREYVGRLAAANEARDVYVLISPRTRYNVWKWKNDHLDLFRGIYFNSDEYEPFAGEVKFTGPDFTEVTSYSDIQLYKFETL